MKQHKGFSREEVEEISKTASDNTRKKTAKEVLIIAIQLSDMCESVYEFQNRLIDLIEINYGVEVETKTIIPEKKRYGVEVK